MSKTIEPASATESAPRSLRRAKLRAFKRVVTARVWRMQDRLISLLGSSPEGRARLLTTALARSPNEAASYWLQLSVAIGIASLGLVLGSAAVIIGAMLVAPLMGPIITLALGLAAGSPFLVLRSAARIGGSVLAAIGGAALITVLLPFHETTSEILARTTPTVLDLVTAAFCALAGVYASLRPGSDTAATAAGTSIGISLVPPLCASGYGLGTGLWTVFGGAALLFLTNLVAILVVGTIAFVAAGFNRVDVTRGERAELANARGDLITAAIARRLAGLFESSWGPGLRFVMPFVLLGAVYVPLRRALDEVVWEVGARAAVKKALAAEQLPMVQSRVRIERHELDLQLVTLGTTADAQHLRERLAKALRPAVSVEPHINVITIPDAASLAGLESSMRTFREPVPVPAPPPSPMAELESGGSFVRASVERLWPSQAAGALLDVQLGAVTPGVPLTIRVAHLGRQLGPDGVESLQKSLGEAFERPVVLVDDAIPDQPMTRDQGDGALIAEVADAVRVSQALEAIHVCVSEPVPTGDKRRRLDARDEALSSALRAVLARHPRATFETSQAWSVHFSSGSCSTPARASEIDPAASP
jgi:uncharacterized hydrophobic protein (TIGR00271 family)